MVREVDGISLRGVAMRSFLSAALRKIRGVLGLGVIGAGLGFISGLVARLFIGHVNGRSVLYDDRRRYGTGFGI